MLTDLQKVKLTRLFNAYDVDNDGFFELEDILDVVGNLARVRGWEEGSDGYQTLAQRYCIIWNYQTQLFDANRDQQVSLDEHLACYDRIFEAHKYDEFIDQLASLVFDIFDADCNGTVSLSEARDFYSAYHLEASLAELVFPHLDLDGDGIISKAEMLRIVREFHLSNDPEAPGNWLFGPLE